MKYYKFFLPFISIVLLSCSNTKKRTDEGVYKVNIDWKNGRDYYITSISEAIRLLDSLDANDVNKTKHYFKKIRNAFKKSEPFCGSLSASVTLKANGPALPIYKEDSGKIIEPIGLQKLEETIYSNASIAKEALDRDIFFQKGLFNVLKKKMNKRALNPKRFFVATHQQLMRLVALSMAGFDTPVSGLSITETSVSLKSLWDIYELTIRKIIIANNSDLDTKLKQNIDKAINYIGTNPNFETFDRFSFIRNHLNPITRNWVDIRKTANIWKPISETGSPFNFNAPTFFEEDSFNANYFLGINDKNPSDARLELGKKLFFDKNLSLNKTMSCATCHIANKGYADGLTLGKDNKNNFLQRNTPSLLNSIYQQAFFWDGSTNTLESQIGNVFKNKKEFANKIHQFSDTILSDSTYVPLFKEAYGKIPTSNKETIRAIMSYVSVLKSFNSKFDKNIRAEEDTFTASEKNGFNLYMGKALCATCHFIPLTNGTVPPYFSDTEKEVIGVPETSKNTKLDDDYGFYWIFKEDLHKGMFKTPTIRNAAITAPYMHNGVYNTLEEVVDFYVKGGGAGMGFDLPHQTLPFDNLNLTKSEQLDLVAFIETLTDDSVKDEYQ